MKIFKVLFWSIMLLLAVVSGLIVFMIFLPWNIDINKIR